MKVISRGLSCFGVSSFLIGASAMDSANIIIPVALVVLGLVGLLAGALVDYEIWE